MLGAQQAIGSKLRRTSTTGSATRRMPEIKTSSRIRASSFRSPSQSGSYSGWDASARPGAHGGFRGFVSARPHARRLRSAPGRRPVPGHWRYRRDHRRTVSDRPRPEAPAPGRSLLRHRDHGLLARSERALRLGPGQRSRPGRSGADPDNAFAIPYIDANHAGTDLDPYRIKERTIADFSVGADLLRYHIPVTVQAMVLNAFDYEGCLQHPVNLRRHPRDPAAALRVPGDRALLTKLAEVRSLRLGRFWILDFGFWIEEREVLPRLARCPSGSAP